MTPTEFWFPLGAMALYLYDSLALLWQNALVYQPTRRGWRVQGGSELRFSGRRVWLPNPLLPHRPQFIVLWNRVAPAAADVESPQPLLQALRPIGWLNLLQVALIASLPLSMWLLESPVLALLAVVLFYLATFAALVVVWLRRATLRLGTKDFWLQALDALACAPFAANMTRKLALRHALPGDPLRFAAAHFDEATLAHTRALVEARVHEEYADPDVAGRGEELLAAVLPRLRRE